MLRLAVNPLGVWLRRRALDAVTDMGVWLARLQGEVTVEAGNLARLAPELEGRLRGIPQLGAAQRSGIMGRFAAVAATQDLPLGLSHGDLSPRNVLYGQRGIKVIDWEMGSLGRLPRSYDLFFFEACLAKRAFDFGANGAFVTALRRRVVQAHILASGAAEAAGVRNAARLLALATVADRHVKACRRRGASMPRTYLAWLVEQLLQEGRR